MRLEGRTGDFSACKGIQIHEAHMEVGIEFGWFGQNWQTLCVLRGTHFASPRPRSRVGLVVKLTGLLDRSRACLILMFLLVRASSIC